MFFCNVLNFFSFSISLLLIVNSFPQNSNNHYDSTSSNPDCLDPNNQPRIKKKDTSDVTSITQDFVLGLKFEPFNNRVC